MIRVLHYIPGFLIGGIESMFISWYHDIDRRMISFELLVRTQESSHLMEQYIQEGGVLHRLERLDVKKPWRFKNSVKRFFERHSDYDIIHCHTSDPYVGYYAMKAGISHIIYHSHTTYDGYGIKLFVHGIIRKHMIKKYVTDAYACSKGAARWAFGSDSLFKGKPIVLIHNGINTDRFKYNERIRNETRSLMSWEKYKVIIFVGRLTPPKNPLFIVGLFSKLCDEYDDVKCVIVGDGPCRMEMENGLKDMINNQKVVFLGTRTDISDLMCASDCMILPSLWEGFPVVLIESQAIGLPAVISDTITDEVDLTDYIARLPIGDTVETWAKKAYEESKKNRKDNTSLINEAGYREMDQIDYLVKEYERLLYE